MFLIFLDSEPQRSYNHGPYKTRPYTRQHQSRAGGQGQYGTWAGAVTQTCSPFSSKRTKTRSDYGQTDGQTDGPT